MIRLTRGDPLPDESKKRRDKILSEELSKYADIHELDYEQKEGDMYDFYNIKYILNNGEHTIEVHVSDDLSSSMHMHVMMDYINNLTCTSISEVLMAIKLLRVFVGDIILNEGIEMEETKLYLKFADFSTVLKLYKLFEQEAIVYTVNVTQQSKTKVNVMGTPEIAFINIYELVFSVEYAGKLVNALIYDGNDSDLELVKIINKKMVDLICYCVEIKGE